jgi:hypothetical protein
MKLKLAILAAATAILFSGGAQAQIATYGFAPAFYDGPDFVDPLIQPARLVCDAWGRCYRVRPRYVAPVYVPPLPFGFYPRHRHHYGYWGRHHR